MNAIGSKLRSVSVIVGNILQQNARGYATLKKLPIEWVRPVEPPCYSKEKSGDGGIEFDINPEERIDFFKASKELDDSNEILKKMTSIEFHSVKEVMKLKTDKAIDMVKRHNYDISSLETQFARLTVKILHLQECLKKHPHEKKSKVACKEAIEKRQKWLKKLRERDYACFEYIIERFNLVFHPGMRPEHYNPVHRKWATKHLLQKYCDDIVQKKLDDYKQKLQDEQISFYKEKAEMLEFVRSEEIACGVEPTVTVEEIEATKQKAALLCK